MSKRIDRQNHLTSADEATRNVVRGFRVTAWIVLVAFLAGSACSRSGEKTVSKSPTASDPPVEACQVKGTETPMVAVRFLEDRVKNDPDDLVALNKLSSYYLQLHRETADTRYLELALRSARASLQVLPAEQNVDGLISLAHAEFQTHDFIGARDHAREFIGYKPNKSSGYRVLGDALLELGDYEAATEAYRKMEELDRGSCATESRLAHLARLHGDRVTAQKRYELALKQAQNAVVPSAETIAWCQWQLGELAFSFGDYAAAQHEYREALTTFPNYFRAIASMGRVQAALGDVKGAIELYQRAIRIIPDPQFVAALGDLYKISGRNQEALTQYLLVEKIGRLSQLNGALYNRQITVFQADHELKPEEAYANAIKELAVRRDIFGADAVAWTAFKAGKIDAARAAMKDALRLGTKEARLYYHAGMIARAAGEANQAHEYLKQALALNPQFDPLQAELARAALNQ